MNLQRSPGRNFPVLPAESLCSCRNAGQGQCQNPRWFEPTDDDLLGFSGGESVPVTQRDTTNYAEGAGRLRIFLLGSAGGAWCLAKNHIQMKFRFGANWPAVVPNTDRAPPSLAVSSRLRPSTH